MEGEEGIGAGGRSDTASAISGDRGRWGRSAAIEGAEVRAREEERGRTTRTKFQKSTHDDWTSIMKCFINAINLIEKFRMGIPMDLIGPIKGTKKLDQKYPWAQKGPVILIC